MSYKHGVGLMLVASALLLSACGEEEAEAPADLNVDEVEDVEDTDEDSADIDVDVDVDTDTDTGADVDTDVDGDTEATDDPADVGDVGDVVEDETPPVRDESIVITISELQEMTTEERNVLFEEHREMTPEISVETPRFGDYIDESDVVWSGIDTEYLNAHHLVAYEALEMPEATDVEMEDYNALHQLLPYAFYEVQALMNDQNTAYGVNDEVIDSLVINVLHSNYDSFYNMAKMARFNWTIDADNMIMTHSSGDNMYHWVADVYNEGGYHVGTISGRFLGMGINQIDVGQSQVTLIGAEEFLYDRETRVE